jgi:hypothetical protein
VPLGRGRRVDGAEGGGEATDCDGHVAAVPNE